jgi:hypothetical protein
MTRERKVHATLSAHPGMGRTFCGLRVAKVEAVQVPWGRFMRLSDGVTCDRCWSVAA